jgi:MFS family permease
MESRSPKDYLLKPEEHFVFWLIVFAALLAMQVGSGWLPGPDESSYLSMARSLGTGHGFTRFSGERYLHYAPGYPLLIAPAFVLQAVRPFVAIGLIQWALAVLFMLGLYLWSRKYFGNHALLLTALVMTNVGFWYYYRRTVPEIGFMAAMIWAVNLLTLATERRIGQAIGLTLAGGALIAFLCWIRPVGVFIASGFGLMLLVLACRGRVSWGRCFLLGGIACVIALASAIGFISRQSVTAAERGPDTVTYTGELLDLNRSLPARVAEGVRLRITEVGRLLIPGMFKSYDARGRWIPNTLFIFLPVFIVFAIGWWRFAMSAPNVLAWAFPFYLGLYIVWWGEQGTRYMMPMLPILWASMWFFAAPWDRFRRPVFAVLVAAHLIVAGIYWTGDLQQTRQLAGYWPKLDRLAAAVQSEPANGAICADRHIGCMFLVALDRGWPIVEKAGAVGPGVRWLLISDDRGDAPGFTTKARAGDLRLMERD